jgi:hypothetical protein
MERERRSARAEELAGVPPDPLARWSGWAFLVCALVATGYAFGALYGSGTRALAIDVTRELEGARGTSTEARLGPYRLEPVMNPLRFILNASHAPLGSSRRRYDLSLEDAAGASLWRSTGSLGSHDDDASIVITRTGLVTFDVPRAGDYYVRVRGSGSSMDDLRAATLELRRGVTRIDTRIPWGFGLAALACLVANLVTSRRRPPVRSAGNDRRAA